MAYVSHAVRSIREEPIPGETVRLVVTAADDADIADLRAALDPLGEVVDELPFDRLLVAVDHDRVGAVCTLDAASAVETDATIGFPS
ncbi:hypothetical protein [Halorussus marinus]|nr:hypothetical protein [Halorussus marinus]